MSAVSQRLFVISGSSGGGKSTLIAELARRGHAVVPEAGRQLVAEQQSIGGVAMPPSELFGHLLLSRSMYLYREAVARAEQADDGGPVFFDRSIIEPIAGWRSAGKFEPHLERAVSVYRYATDVFMTPPWPEMFERDTERRHGYDPEQREYHRLAETFPAFGYRVVVLPKTSVARRADFVEAHVAEALDQSSAGASQGPNAPLGPGNTTGDS